MGEPSAFSGTSSMATSPAGARDGMDMAMALFLSLQSVANGVWGSRSDPERGEETGEKRPREVMGEGQKICGVPFPLAARGPLWGQRPTGSKHNRGVKRKLKK